MESVDALRMVLRVCGELTEIAEVSLAERDEIVRYVGDATVELDALEAALRDARADALKYLAQATEIQEQWLAGTTAAGSEGNPEDVIRATLKANGVYRYGRYERENTYAALDALDALEADRAVLVAARDTAERATDFYNGAFCGLCGARYAGELPSCGHDEREMIPGSDLPSALARSLERDTELADELAEAVAARDEARRERDEAQKWANTMEHERDWERDVVQSELRSQIEAAEASRDIAVDALKRAQHIAENIADPYNERISRLHGWGADIVALARAALVELNPDGLSGGEETPQGIPQQGQIESPGKEPARPCASRVSLEVSRRDEGSADSPSLNPDGLSEDDEGEPTADKDMARRGELPPPTIFQAEPPLNPDGLSGQTTTSRPMFEVLDEIDAEEEEAANPDGLSEPVPTMPQAPEGSSSPGSLSPSSEVAACPRCGSTASYWSHWPPGTFRGGAMYARPDGLSEPGRVSETGSAPDGSLSPSSEVAAPSSKCEDCGATVTPSGYCVMCGKYNAPLAAEAAPERAGET